MITYIPCCLSRSPRRQDNSWGNSCLQKLPEISEHKELTTVPWMSSLVCTTWNLLISNQTRRQKAPTKKLRLHQKHFLYISIACRDQGCCPSEKFSEVDELVFLFPIILVPLSWNAHNCNIPMSCGISSSFSSSRMRVGSRSVRFPSPSWRFQRGSHQLQMPRCFSSASWLFSPHKDLEGS